MILNILFLSSHSVISTQKESLLAKVGGETAPAPGPAASCSSSNGNSNRAAPDEFPEDNSVGQVMKHRGRRIQDSDDLGSEESLQLPVPPPSSASSLHLQEPVVPGCQATATSSLEVPEPMAVTEEADPAHSNNNSISSGGAHKEEEEEGVVEPAAKRPRT